MAPSRCRRKERIVKYMIMLYGSQQFFDMMAGRPSDVPAMTVEELSSMHKYMEDFHQALAESGELVETQGLTAPAHARRVQLEDGVPVVTDGPYPETEEVLAGFTIVECESFDRATEIAAGLVNPDAEGGYVDIRPVVESIADLVT
jgi:hypothetical protein